MATVKKANVPPTHPTVWVGLALAAVGLLLATYAYTGERVYQIGFAFVALLGAFVALAGILVAAWGRSIMAARASRSRRAAFKEDALALAKPVAVDGLAAPASEDAPTVAASREKKRFAFPIPMPRRGKEGPREAARPKEAAGGSVFAFKRRATDAAPQERSPQRVSAAREAPEAREVPRAGDASEAREARGTEPAPPLTGDDPRDPAVSSRLDAELDAIGDLRDPKAVRVTLKCPSCASTFTAEGVRPFQAVCTSCGFSATI